MELDMFRLRERNWTAFTHFKNSHIKFIDLLWHSFSYRAYAKHQSTLTI